MVKVPDWGNPVEPASVSNSGISVDRPGMASAEYGAKALKYQAFASIANVLADDFERSYQQRQEAERRMRVASKTADISRAAFDLKTKFRDYQDFDQVRPSSKKQWEEKVFPIIDEIQDPAEKAAVYAAATPIGLDLEVDAEAYSFNGKKNEALAKAEADLRHSGQEFAAASNATARRMNVNNTANYIEGLYQAGYLSQKDAQDLYVKTLHNNITGTIQNKINARNPAAAMQVLEEHYEALDAKDYSTLEAHILESDKAQKSVSAQVMMNQVPNLLAMRKNGIQSDDAIEEIAVVLEDSGQEARAEILRQEYKNVGIGADAYEAVKMSRPEDIPAIIKEKFSDKSYTEQLAVMAEIPKVLAKRNEDPALAVEDAFGELAATPAGRVAAQQTLGIPEWNQRIYKNNTAKQIKAQLEGLKSDPTALTQALQQAVFGQGEEYSSMAYKDLKRAGVDSAIMALALMPADEPMVLDAIAKAANTSDAQLKDLMPDNDTRQLYIDGIYEDVDMIAFVESYKSAGMPVGDIADMQNALAKGAMMMTISNKVEQSAAIKSMTKWVPDSYIFGSSNVSHTLRIPKEYSKLIYETTDWNMEIGQPSPITKKVSTVTSILDKELDKLSGLGNNPRTAAAYGLDIPSVIAAGQMYWANTRDDKGVTLYYGGKAVPITKGDIEFRLTLPFNMIQNSTPGEDLIQKAIKLNMEALKPVKPVAPVDNRPATAADVFGLAPLPDSLPE